MAITIFWSIFESEWQRASEPIALQKLLNDGRYVDDGDISAWLRCPATRDYSKNVFGLKSLYSYQFKIQNNDIFSSTYDQNFFDRHVKIRSIPNKLFSFTQNYIFFTENDLDVTFELQPHFEFNNINQRCILTPGIFNIGKYFRTIDFSFFLKPEYNEFIINEGDIYQYISFNTNEKIKFKQFIPTQELQFFEYSNINIKENKNVKFNLNKYYSLFKTKNQVLKNIKQNLL